jgi:ectoine hydroxylase
LIEIMEKNADPVAIVGKPGTVVFFHPTILHGSGHNMSRHDRWQIYYVYNKVANRPINVDSPRPDYVRSTNWNALQLGEDDILGKTPALVD